MGLLPRESRSVRLVRTFMPHLLDELNDVPEQFVNQATAFILLALARVQDPNATQVLVDVTNRRVLAAEPVAGADTDGRHFMVRAANEVAFGPALPSLMGATDGTALAPVPESASRNGSGNGAAPPTA